MKTIPPSPSYDQENESNFREECRRADAENMKPLQAVTSFIMVNTAGAAHRITLVGSTLTVTAL